MRSIKISDGTYGLLLGLKRGNDTFDSVIRRAVAYYGARKLAGQVPSDDERGAIAGKGE